MRKARQFSPGNMYHISSKLIPELHLSKKNLEQVYEYVKQLKNKYNIKIVSFNILSNHYHLQVFFPKGSKAHISKVMHWFNTVFAMFVNRTLKRTGSVLASRFWSKLITSIQQAKNTIEYIINNPFNHYGIPAKYWVFSSYDAYKKGHNDLVTTHIDLIDYLHLE